MHNPVMIEIHEIKAAQETWGKAVVGVGAASSREEARFLAVKLAEELYAIDGGELLFCPTKASVNQFRASLKDVVSYFVGATPTMKRTPASPWSHGPLYASRTQGSLRGKMSGSPWATISSDGPMARSSRWSIPSSMCGEPQAHSRSSFIIQRFPTSPEPAGGLFPGVVGDWFPVRRQDLEMVEPRLHS